MLTSRIVRGLIQTALALVLASPMAGQPVTEGGPQGSLTQATEGQSGQGGVDGAAQAFLTKCSGCHSLGGSQRSAPDLLHVAAWDDGTLRGSIQRMTKHVGALPEAEVLLLASFLKDSGVRTRLAAEEQRAARLAASALEPASPSKGRALFVGSQVFSNGGSSCSPCHAVAGNGGNLGPDLTTIHSRLGDVGLVSAIEQANFRVMKPIYTTRPVTKQEAAHLAAYLASAAESDPAEQQSLLGLAAIVAALMLGLTWLVARSGKKGTRARLVDEATRR